MFSTAKMELNNCTIQLILTSVNRTNSHAPAKNVHLIRNVFIMVSSGHNYPKPLFEDETIAQIMYGGWGGGGGDNFLNVAVKFCPTLPLPVRNFWSNLLVEDVFLEILIY